MKKIISYGWILTVMLAFGCRKDSQNPKIYLLDRAITDTRENGGGLDTTYFTYDDHDRVISVTDGIAPHKLTFRITAFDGQNRVLHGQKLDNNGTPVTQYDFFYGPDTTGYFFYAPSRVIADTSYITFNGNHQVSRIASKHSGAETYAYDNRGNIILTESYNADGSINIVNDGAYQYDTMKNPLSSTSRNNLFLMYIIFLNNPTTLINNVSDKNGYKYTYTYNADGFPVNGSVNYFYYQTYFTYLYKLR
ncbi:MAG: hypothetical protein JST32_05760 [Bacteroidetes bacterium]|nr:hypothetical protein [Bacteroidota bacterium]